MGVYIKGMRMPRECKKCEYCSIGLTDIFCLQLKKVVVFDGRRLDDCPLVEVKEPHGRLIDADKLVRTLNEMSVEMRKDAVGDEEVNRATGIAMASKRTLGELTVIEAEGE